MGKACPVNGIDHMISETGNGIPLLFYEQNGCIERKVLGILVLSRLMRPKSQSETSYGDMVLRFKFVAWQSW